MISAYLDWLKHERHLKPLWLAADDKTERYLADKFDWRVVSVISEQRVEVDHADATGDKNVQRKRAHAEKAGLTFHTINEEITPELQAEIEQCIHAWCVNLF